MFNKRTRTKKQDSRFKLAIEAKKINKKNKSLIKKAKIEVIENPIYKALYKYNALKNNSVTIDNDYELVLRIVLNYIRHKHTNYEKLYRQFNQNFDMEQYDLKEKMNQAIMKKYNNFEEELN